MPDNFILFEVHGAVYAVRSELVQVVEMVETITPVPNAPAFVEGVTAVRGQIIPVVSMRRRFGLPDVERTLRTRLVVIRLEGRLIGMLVDSARVFLRTSEAIQPPPEGLSGPAVEYLDGIFHHNHRLVLVVNLPRLFSAQERTALAESEQ